MVRCVDTRRVVDGVGVAEASQLVELDAGALGHTEIAAFTHHLDAQFAGVDPETVIAPVLGILLRFRRSLDVGADTAVPEEFHLGLEDGVDQVVRRIGVAFHGERLHRLR